MPIPPLVEHWRARGTTANVLGHEVFYVDTGPRDSEPLLILHGFPTSSLDYHRCLDQLAATRRVVLHDHLGFGLSAKPADYSYALIEQADVAIALWNHLGIERGHVVAHDYGTSIATELLARREWADDTPKLYAMPRLCSLTMSNGSVYLELAKLRLAQRISRSRLGPLFGRLVPGAYVKRVLRRLWGDPNRIDADELDAMWWSMRHRDGHLRTHQMSSYLDDRVRFRRRWIGPLQRLDLPTLVLWGDRDPIAVPAMAERVAADVPDSTLHWLRGIGHFPMLEAPETWATEVAAFVDRVDRDE